MNNFPITVTRRSTWHGLTVTYKIDDVAVDLTDATIELEVKNDYSDTDPIIQLSVNSGITILDAENGIFQVDKRIFDISPKTYVYDLAVRSPDHTHYLIGGNFTVEPVVTKIVE